MKALMVMCILLCASVPLASAHPFTEQTMPDASSNAPAGTTEVIVYFSEPVDIGFSEMKVFDASGNQIDNRDTKYHEDELSIIVTTPPMEDGIYTATTKVLSKVDGHLVPGAFVFGVGDVVVDIADIPEEPSELVFLPEAGARFPGLVGQTMVLGAAIASLAIWGTQNKRPIKDELEEIARIHHAKFMSLTGVGLVLVFVSGILMIAIQTVRLEASPVDVIQTYFGTVWLARMIITVVLLGVWFAMDKKGALSGRMQGVMLGASLALISTTSMIGHGAASGETGALVLDYVHNLVAAVWIGGIIYFVFALLPALSHVRKDLRERMSLVMIPRFSMAFVISVGVVIVTGPTLLWFLESDVGLITESVFGQLIMLKIAIAAAMVGLGGFFQLRVQRDAERGSGKIHVHGRLRRSLKVDAALGIVLLGVVALLTNGTLPAGEIQRADAQVTIYGYSTTEFTENAIFEIDIVPFTSGANTITVRATDFDGNQLYDSESVKVKISNPSRNISPIEVPMRVVSESEPAEFEGEITFGFSGQWLVEVEAQREENANESKMLNLLVKPRLADIRMEVTEYELPEEAKPLHIIYGQESLWISDASAPRLWEFSPDTLEFASYTFDGLAATFLTQDGDGDIWFVDTPRNQLGRMDMQTGEITTVTIPKLDPVISDNTPIFLQADLDGNIWVSIVNKDRIVKYAPDGGTFEEIAMPQKESLPFALGIDDAGRIWYTATGAGKIGHIDPQTGALTQIESDVVLAGPEALLFDPDGSIWITEHTGTALVRFDPVLGTFERITVPDPEALPFGMTFDRYGNVWFAQHVIDSIGVYDPDNGDLREVPIPTESSFVQFMASDGDGNVWFVEQNGNKLGTIRMTEVPVSPSQVQSTDSTGLRYTEIASPLIALGILATSLFYVKAVNDKRRLGGLLGE